MRTSFLPGLALWSLFPRPQSHGPTFWTVFYGKRLVNAVYFHVNFKFPRLLEQSWTTTTSCGRIPLQDHDYVR